MIGRLTDLSERAKMTVNPVEKESIQPHPADAERVSASRRLNWLRAGVLGANDGVVAISGLVIGVAASGAGATAVFTAGMAGLAAGALSMAAGEYVSVSTQRDTEAAMLASEQHSLTHFPEDELNELTDMYRAKGLSEDLARAVAVQLTEHDALAAHAEVELRIDHTELTNPWHAAGASLMAFIAGSILPLLTILLIPGPIAIPLTVLAAVLSLALTGWISASLGGAKARVAILRNVIGGVLAMLVTYIIGALVGTHIG
jgi:VIT1/CCC1 family predicted Fe2+/Mn2+ transporter